MVSVKHEAKVTVLGDASKLKRAMGEAEKSVKDATQDIDKSGSKMAGAMKMHLAVLGAAVVAGIGKFVASSVSAANDLNESINAVNVVFEDSSSTIHKWAQDAAEDMGMSQRAVNQAIIPIGAMLKNMGFETDDVAEKTMMLTQRAVDLGSQLNVTADVAMEKFRAGLAGESEPLKAFGVDVSVAALTTEALKLGLIESGEALDRNARAQAAMSIIMRETEDAAGDFANTLEGSLSNQIKALKANTENMSARLGQKMLPAVLEVTSAFANLTDEGGLLEDIMGVVADAAASLGEELAAQVNKIDSFWRNIKFAVGELGLFEGAIEAVEEAQKKWWQRSGNIIINGLEELSNRVTVVREETELLKEAQLEAAAGADVHLAALQPHIPTLEELAQATEDLEEAEEDLRGARLAAINTELGKIRADQDAAEALENLIEVQQDAKSTTEDIRVAELEYAAAAETAKIKTEAWNAELDKLDGRAIDVSIAYNWITKGAEKIASVISSNPQMRARGGPVRKGQPYVVGEEGPEAFVPDTSGTIIPFNGSRTGFDGGGIIVNIYPQGHVLAEDDLVRMVIDGIEKARRRGLSA